jgi:hypothetical protein
MGGIPLQHGAKDLDRRLQQFQPIFDSAELHAERLMLRRVTAGPNAYRNAPFRKGGNRRD